MNVPCIPVAILQSHAVFIVIIFWCCLKGNDIIIIIRHVQMVFHGWQYSARSLELDE